MTSQHEDKAFNLLLAATGSVATVKVPLLVQKLKEKFKKVHNIILKSNQCH